MSYFPNSSQLHDDTLLTDLKFVTGSIISGVILYFLRLKNECSLSESTLEVTQNQSKKIDAGSISQSGDPLPDVDLDVKS